VVAGASCGDRPCRRTAAPEIEKIFATNVFGPSLLASAALPKEAGGSIVNVSSTLGHKAGPGLSQCAASKAALEHLTPVLGARARAPRNPRECRRGGPDRDDFLRERMKLSEHEAETVKATSADPAAPAQNARRGRVLDRLARLAGGRLDHRRSRRRGLAG